MWWHQFSTDLLHNKRLEPIHGVSFVKLGAVCVANLQIRYPLPYPLSLPTDVNINKMQQGSRNFIATWLSFTFRRFRAFVFHCNFNPFSYYRLYEQLIASYTPPNGHFHRTKP